MAAAVAQVNGSAAVPTRKILCSDPIEDNCIKTLERAGFEVHARAKVPLPELLQIIGDYDGLIVRSGTQVTREVIEAGTNLKLIGRAGVGCDNVDLDAASRAGLSVVNCPGGNTASAAELSVSLLMALSRNIPSASQSLKAGKWERKAFTGIELQGKTIGVIGLGQIGRRVAAACLALDMKVVGYDPLMSREVAEGLQVQLLSLEDIYPVCDFITLHTPLTPDTRNLFNDQTFAKCKHGLRIINCARGGIIDEDALLRALESGQVAGAGLDVFEQEPPPESTMALLNHPNVICTPHLGASTGEAQEKVAQEIADQFMDYFEGRSVRGMVNSRILSELSGRPALRPYAELSERLGRMIAQIYNPVGGKDKQAGRLERISVTTRGEELGQSSHLLLAAALKGILSQMVAENVNLINAPPLATEFGINVSQMHEVVPSAHGNSVTVTIHQQQDDGASSSHRLVGTVVGCARQPRVVQIDAYRMEIAPEGNWLIFSNDDRPGVIAGVCALLGGEGINIGNFVLGRLEQGGRAMAALNTDQEIPAELLRRIIDMPSIQWARATRLASLDPEFAGVKNLDMPVVRPKNPQFSSGPCKKRPGYDLAKLNQRCLGRSHRSAIGKLVLGEMLQKTRAVLGLPADYHVALVPGSDTGAFEMAMWNLLGARPVDLVHFETFGSGWHKDAHILGLENYRDFKGAYGELPDLAQVNAKEHDVVFTWNGTTSGVRVPDGDWIPDDREGLTLCDATSAVFSMDLPWNKLDVTTFSWQKALGGEAGHGMLIMSPRAIQRLQEFTPQNRPIPKVLRLKSPDGSKILMDVFEGSPINTPSMLAVEDCIDALDWAQQIGGARGMQARTLANYQVLERFVALHDWVDFLAEDVRVRSPTSVTLRVIFAEGKLRENQSPEDGVKAMVKALEKQGVAFDLGGHRDAPAGLRVWCGATVETADVQALTHWLIWAYNHAKDF